MTTAPPRPQATLSPSELDVPERDISGLALSGRDISGLALPGLPALDPPGFTGPDHFGTGSSAADPSAADLSEAGASAAGSSGAAGGGFRVRTARPEDAAALADLSRPFVRSGALRERPLSLYAEQAADFLVAESPEGGALDGCLGLRAHAAAGVLYNFCVAGHRQGCGTGARLLRAALTKARSRSLRTLFTATTGGGHLFLRHGFAPTHVSLAPSAWARSLDPRRNARVLARAL